MQCGSRLAEMCSNAQYTEAMQELYADNARHVEAMEMPGSPRGLITEGKAALQKKAAEWAKAHTVHSSSCSKPRFNGDQFSCEMATDVTNNEGPMAGQRMTMSETALYTVNNGKIVEGKFFYAGGEK